MILKAVKLDDGFCGTPAGRLAGSQRKPMNKGEKKLLDNHPRKC
jgi:hypothetical protein